MHWLSIRLSISKQDDICFNKALNCSISEIYLSRDSLLTSKFIHKSGTRVVGVVHLLSFDFFSCPCLLILFLA